MVSDDDRFDGDLLELLEVALAEAPPEPPPERVAALRARARHARTTSAPSARGREGWLLATAAAAVALLAGVVGGTVLDRASGPTSAGVVEYDGTLFGPEGEASEARLTVVRTGIGRVIELDTDELPILPTGEYYEVWFVAPDENRAAANRISAGTFHPDQDGRSGVRFAAAVDPAKFPNVEITAEPGDGDPAATGPVVLRSDDRWLTPPGWLSPRSRTGRAGDAAKDVAGVEGVLAQLIEHRLVPVVGAASQDRVGHRVGVGRGSEQAGGALDVPAQLAHQANDLRFGAVADRLP